jgi:hypothetical protein
MKKAILMFYLLAVSSMAPAAFAGNNPPFRCKDIFSDANFKSVTKKNIEDYKLDEKNKDYQLSCSYVLKDVSSTLDIWGPIFTITWGTDRKIIPTVKDAYEGMKKQYMNKEKGPLKLGFGADAHVSLFGPTVVLSSNQKYMISGVLDDAGTFIAAAKIVDLNLKKY